MIRCYAILLLFLLIGLAYGNMCYYHLKGSGVQPSVINGRNCFPNLEVWNLAGFKVGDATAFMCWATITKSNTDAFGSSVIEMTTTIDLSTGSFMVFANSTLSPYLAADQLHPGTHQSGFNPVEGDSNVVGLSGSYQTLNGTWAQQFGLNNLNGFYNKQYSIVNTVFVVHFPEDVDCGAQLENVPRVRKQCSYHLEAQGQMGPWGPPIDHWYYKGMPSMGSVCYDRLPMRNAAGQPIDGYGKQCWTLAHTYTPSAAQEMVGLAVFELPDGNYDGYDTVQSIGVRSVMSLQPYLDRVSQTEAPYLYNAAASSSVNSVYNASGVFHGRVAKANLQGSMDLRYFPHLRNVSFDLVYILNFDRPVDCHDGLGVEVEKPLRPFIPICFDSYSYLTSDVVRIKLPWRITSDAPSSFHVSYILFSTVLWVVSLMLLL